MEKDRKSDVISEIKENLENSMAVYLVDYKGIDVEDINEIRRNFRKEGIKYKVYKNTLFQKAIESREEPAYKELSNLLVGMTGYVFAGDNYVEPAKIIKKYSKEKDKLNLKGCIIENQYYPGDQIDAISSMPTKPEIIAGILGSLDSPISGIVGVLSGLARDLANIIDQRCQQLSE